MKKAKNVILFIVDGHRVDQLGCYGGRLARTPNVDAFAAAGVRCDGAYCAHSVCMPTRASIYTGRYPHVHGVWANGVTLPRSETTLPEVLRSHGYATAACGKIHFEPQQPYLHEKRSVVDGARAVIPRLTAAELPYYGFDEVHHCENLLGEEYLDDMRARVPEMMPLILGRTNVPEEFHELTWITDRAIDVIHRHAADGTPFFCHCSFHELCPPCRTPAGFAGLTDPADVALPELREDDLAAKPEWYRRCFEAYTRSGMQPDEAALRQAIASNHDQMRFIDKQFGRLLTALRETGVEDETIVLYTADHGLSLNDHWQWRHGPFLFDEVVHIPMIWRVPGITPAGRGSTALVEQVDIMPTILTLCGLPLPDTVQGVPILEVLTEPDTAPGKEAVLLQERQAPDLKVRNIPPEDITQIGLRTRQWKFIQYVGRDMGELYDLENDPREYHNLWYETRFNGLKRDLASMLCERLYTTSPFPACPYDW